MVIFTVFRWVFIATSTPVIVPCTWCYIVSNLWRERAEADNRAFRIHQSKWQEWTVLFSNPTEELCWNFFFYLSSILHLDGDSLVRELHQEPHQLHSGRDVFEIWNWANCCWKGHYSTKSLTIIRGKTNHKGEDFDFLCGGGIGNRLERNRGWMPRSAMNSELKCRLATFPFIGPMEFWFLVIKGETFIEKIVFNCFYSQPLE